MKNILVFMGIVCLVFSFSSQALAQVVNGADIVLVVDESGSMAGEHSWINGMVSSLQAALVTAGVTDNQYALIGFGNRYVVPRTINGLQTLPLSTGLLEISGGTEDGYAGISYAMNNLSFRAGAAVNYILITDEDRDTIAGYGGVTYASLLANLQGQNALLNAVVDARYYNSAESAYVLGKDSAGIDYIADGAGGYTTVNPGTSAFYSDYGTTRENYVELALATGGANWDLNLLRAGGLTANSFTQAFVAIKVQEIQEQVDPGNNAVPEPATMLLFGPALLGMISFKRKKA
ncbi:MAG: PEP-CTERM sorting domain-containing protein [Candidatus Omnitrophica bacterium]|nr:PEP-CTERM sorting domain-containing protein [Candidatus Omnitrophota bacterium]